MTQSEIEKIIEEDYRSIRVLITRLSDRVEDLENTNNFQHERISLLEDRIKEPLRGWDKD